MRRLITAVAVAALLTGCASASPQATLQSRANAVVRAANAGDAAALRTAAALLLQEVNTQDAQADLPASKAAALRTLVNRVLANAGLLDQPEPSPTPSATESSPTPTPSPTPSETAPTQEPTPSPTPSEVVPSIIIGGSDSPEPSPSQS